MEGDWFCSANTYDNMWNYLFYRLVERNCEVSAPQGGMLEPIYNILGFQYLPIPLSFIFIVVLSGVLGSLLNLIPVMGEEMGWRGYMLTRLIDAEFSRPILISGLIWATWHVPIVIAGLYVEGTSALLSVLGIYFCIVPFSYITAYLRLITGSVWPSVIIHTTWNAIIQGLSHVQVQEIKLRFGLENLV